MTLRVSGHSDGSFFRTEIGPEHPIFLIHKRRFQQNFALGKLECKVLYPDIICPQFGNGKGSCHLGGKPSFPTSPSKVAKKATSKKRLLRRRHKKRKKKALVIVFRRKKNIAHCRRITCKFRNYVQMFRKFSPKVNSKSMV